jgi:hypothetical protein
LTSISQLLEPGTSLTGTALLDSATIGAHYYDSRALEIGAYFSPPHKDSGTLTILFRSHVKNDGLEIANLDSTEEIDSDTVGRDASFIPIRTPSDEALKVIVLRALDFSACLEVSELGLVCTEYVVLAGEITIAADYND